MQRTPVRLLPRAAPTQSRERRLSYNESFQPAFDLTNIQKDTESAGIVDASTPYHLATEAERQRRHYARLVAFQLPELAKKYQNKFQPPPASHHIRLRVQDYMGEPHPANNKVTLSLSIPKLGLSSSEAHNFKLIAGPRWDSTNDTFTISCDSEQSREGNAKWCSDVLERLISEAKTTTLNLSELPLDDRHTQAKLRKKPKSRQASIADFPKAWLSAQPKQKQEKVTAISSEGANRSSAQSQEIIA